MADGDNNTIHTAEDSMSDGDNNILQKIQCVMVTINGNTYYRRFEMLMVTGTHTTEDFNADP